MAPNAISKTIIHKLGHIALMANPILWVVNTARVAFLAVSIGQVSQIPPIRDDDGPYFIVMLKPLTSALTCRPTCLPESSSWAPLSLVMTII